MTAPARPSGDLRVAVASLEYGGLPENGDDSAWCKSMACLLVRAPDVLLVQGRLHAHLRRTAGELGMIPVLGPASPDPVPGNHPAVPVNTGAGLQILHAGPPPYPAHQVHVSDAGNKASDHRLISVRPDLMRACQ
jgi:hypothetical protein